MPFTGGGGEDCEGPVSRGRCLCLEGERPDSAAGHCGIALGWSKQRKKRTHKVMGGQNWCLFTAEQLRCLGRLMIAMQRYIKEKVDNPCGRPTSRSYSTGCPSRQPVIFSAGPAWVTVSLTSSASRGQPGRGEDSYCSQSSYLLNMLRQINVLGYSQQQGSCSSAATHPPSLCAFPVLWIFSLKEFISWFMKKRVGALQSHPT